MRLLLMEFFVEASNVVGNLLEVFFGVFELGQRFVQVALNKNIKL